MSRGYLAFCNRASSVDREKIKQYISKLEKDTIGVDRILTKIDRLQTAINYGII